MQKKRDVSILIPYKIKNQEIFVYLQKRSKDKKVLPSYFAFFGGKLEEGENPEEALDREIKEELCFNPKGQEFLGKYDFTGELVVGWSANAYFLKVSDNFEKEIKVMEGEYGKFFSEDEVAKEPMLINEDKKIIRDLYKLLKDKK